MGEDRFGALRATLAAHGQEHLLRFWADLGDAGRARLERDIRSLDLDVLDRLVETLVRAGDVPVDVEGVEPARARPCAHGPERRGGRGGAALRGRSRS